MTLSLRLSLSVQNFSQAMPNTMLIWVLIAQKRGIARPLRLSSPTSMWVTACFPIIPTAQHSIAPNTCWIFQEKKTRKKVLFGQIVKFYVFPALAKSCPLFAERVWNLYGNSVISHISFFFLVTGSVFRIWGCEYGRPRSCHHRNSNGTFQSFMISGIWRHIGTSGKFFFFICWWISWFIKHCKCNVVAPFFSCCNWSREKFPLHASGRENKRYQLFIPRI